MAVGKRQARMALASKMSRSTKFRAIAKQSRTGECTTVIDDVVRLIAGSSVAGSSSHGRST